METLTPTASPPPTGLTPKPWGLPAVLLALALPVLLLGSSLVVSATVAEEDLTQGEVIATLIVTIVLDFALIGMAAGLSLWRYGLGWPALGLRSFRRSIWWWPVVAAAAAHIAIIIYSLVLTGIGAEGAVPEQEDLEELFEGRAVLPLAGVTTVLVAPLAEEIYFRGFIFAGLLRPFGLVGAMVVSGLIFGAFHITGPDSFGLVLPFGAIGMLFAWLYYKTGSLWQSIGAHLVFNLVSFAILASVSGGGSS